MDDGQQAFCALLDVYLPDAGELARIGGEWLEVASRELVPSWWERVVASLPSGERGEPGGVAAYVSLTPRPWQGVDTKLHSPDSFASLLGGLADRPLDATVRIQQLDERGLLPDGPPPGGMVVSVVTDDQRPQWVQLRASASVPGADGQVYRPEVSARWARTLKAVAAQCDPAFGHLCDDARGNRPALDVAVRREKPGASESVAASRELLRGYSWVTVCPSQLAIRLGGASALAQSGAFWQVEELPSGAVWLQATPDFAGYDDTAMRRVFEVLAPVLPQGIAAPEPIEELHYRLVWEDAAWYRPGGREALLASQVALPQDTMQALASATSGAASVRRVTEGYELSFKRNLPHGAAAIWQVLTDPAAVMRWTGWRAPHVHVPEPTIDLRPGGRIVFPYCFPTDSRGPRIARNTTMGTITAMTPPELLGYILPGQDGPDASVRWHVRPVAGGGCQLNLRYAFQIYARLPRLLADWDCRLDAIAVLLSGGDPASIWADWATRHQFYQAVTANARA